jgi:hypothetical protein
MLPGATNVDLNLGLRTVLSPSCHQNGNDPFAYAARLIIALTIFVPALLYRMNIKANAIIWGSIGFALSPTVWLDDEEMRESAAFWTDKHLLYPVFGGVWLALMGWLLTPFISFSSSFFSDILKISTVSEFGLRYFSMIALLFSMGGLIIASHAMRSAHVKALEGAGDYDKYPDSIKPRFATHALRVRRLLKITLAIAVITSWIWLLWAASSGPLARIVRLPKWEWLPF